MLGVRGMVLVRSLLARPLQKSPMPRDTEEPTALSLKHVICKVLVLTHEATKVLDTDDYFARKFYPAVPLFVMSRSYKMPPECKPNETLFDCWKDLFVLTRSTCRKISHVFCR